MRNKFYLIICLGLVFLSASSFAIVTFKAADEKFQTPINRLGSYEAYKMNKMASEASEEYFS